MEKILALIPVLEGKIPHFQKVDNRISAASVGWHIAHSFQVIEVILGAVQKSDPSQYVWSFNGTRLLVFTLGKIPRGKAQAPKAAQPAADFTIESLQEKAKHVAIKLKELGHLHPNAHFLHPIFGQLNVKLTKKMLKIHTEHHLKIIDDIIKAAI